MPATGAPPTTTPTPATPPAGPAPPIPERQPAPPVAAPETKPVAPEAQPGPVPSPTAATPSPTTPTPAVEPRSTTSPAASMVPAATAEGARSPNHDCLASGQSSSAPASQIDRQDCKTPAKCSPARWCLKTWIHSLRKRPSQPLESCQLPPATFPTTYRTCVPVPATACKPDTDPVFPTPQTEPIGAPCPATAPCAPGAPWFHRGMICELFKKMKSWRPKCHCPCHSSAKRAEPPPCQPCSGCTVALASPQLPASAPQGQASVGSGTAQPRYVAEGRQVLERIAVQGLDKSPEN